MGSTSVLLTATVLALVWANLPFGASYEAVWHTPLSLALGDATLTLDLRHWVNDGLMVLFFFVIGLEVSREFSLGQLRNRRLVAVPALAALGGIVVPAGVYLLTPTATPTFFLKRYEGPFEPAPVSAAIDAVLPAPASTATWIHSGLWWPPLAPLWLHNAVSRRPATGGRWSPASRLAAGAAPG